MTWIVIGIALLIVAFVFITINKTSRLLSDSHLIEISNELVRLKSNALNHVETLPDLSATNASESGAATSQGLIICYTIEREEAGMYQHRLSFSRADEVLTHSTGRILAGWCEYTLALPTGRLLAVPDAPSAFSGVQHYGLTLDSVEQNAFAERKVLIPPPEEIKEQLKLILARRPAVVVDNHS